MTDNLANKEQLLFDIRARNEKTYVSYYGETTSTQIGITLDCDFKMEYSTTTTQHEVSTTSAIWMVTMVEIHMFDIILLPDWINCSECAILDHFGTYVIILLQVMSQQHKHPISQPINSTTHARKIRPSSVEHKISSNITIVMLSMVTNDIIDNIIALLSMNRFNYENWQHFHALIANNRSVAAKTVVNIQDSDSNANNESLCIISIIDNIFDIIIDIICIYCIEIIINFMPSVQIIFELMLYSFVYNVVHFTMAGESSEMNVGLLCNNVCDNDYQFLCDFLKNIAILFGLFDVFNTNNVMKSIKVIFCTICKYFTLFWCLVKNYICNTNSNSTNIITKSSAAMNMTFSGIVISILINLATVSASKDIFATIVNEIDALQIYFTRFVFNYCNYITITTTQATGILTNKLHDIGSGTLIFLHCNASSAAMVMFAIDHEICLHLQTKCCKLILMRFIAIIVCINAEITYITITCRTSINNPLTTTNRPITHP